MTTAAFGEETILPGVQYRPDQAYPRKRTTRDLCSRQDRLSTMTCWRACPSWKATTLTLMNSTLQSLSSTRKTGTLWKEVGAFPCLS